MCYRPMVRYFTNTNPELGSTLPMPVCQEHYDWNVAEVARLEAMGQTDGICAHCSRPAEVLHRTFDDGGHEIFIPMCVEHAKQASSDDQRDEIPF